MKTLVLLLLLAATAEAHGPQLHRKSDGTMVWEINCDLQGLLDAARAWAKVQEPRTRVQNMPTHDPALITGGWSIPEWRQALTPFPATEILRDRESRTRQVIDHRLLRAIGACSK